MPLRPSARAIQVAQDRIQEKEFLQSCSIPICPFSSISSKHDIEHAGSELFPGILKTSRLGYDGHGQIRVERKEDLLKSWQDLSEVPCVLEKALQLEAEFSILGVRGADGEIVIYDPVDNVHVNHILDTSHVPSRRDSREQLQAKDCVQNLLKAFHYLWGAVR